VVLRVVTGRTLNFT